MAPMTLSGAKDCIAKDPVSREEHLNSTQSSSFDRVNRIIKNSYRIPMQLTFHKKIVVST